MFRMAEVLEKLIASTSTDIRAISGFDPMLFRAPVEGINADNPAALHMPIDPTDVEYVQLVEILDKHETLAGERSGLREFGHVTYQLYYKNIIAYLHSRFGGTATRFVNILHSVVIRDIFKNWRKAHRNLQRQKDIDHDELALTLIWHYSPENETYEQSDLNALQSLAGFALTQRMKDIFKSNIPKALDTCVRLLVHNEKLQQKALLMLQNMRLIPQSYLAEAMVRQGYRTFAKMEEMTEYDIWAKIKREKECTALDLMNVSPQEADSIGAEMERVLRYFQESLDNTSPEKVRQKERLERNIAFFEKRKTNIEGTANGTACNLDILGDHDREMWDKASTYLQTHEKQPRRLLKDVIGCDTARAELKELRATCQWNSLAAKEKEIVQRIFGQVMLFAYENEPDGALSYQEQAFRVGTPAYAAKQRKINCFTGPWLIASLCLEAGIPYNQLYYCSVNEASGGNATRFSNHCSLLIKYSDGMLAITDSGYHIGMQPLPLAAISEKSQKNHLSELMDTGKNAARMKEKIHTYPVRVQVKAPTADTLKVPRDMHVLPLDLGLAGNMLLHTGIAFEQDGKRAEAKAAYELGLVSNPASPDLLCRLGIIAIQEKEYAHADHLLNLALQAYPLHLHALYYSGMLAWHVGDKPKAYGFFTIVKEDPREVWGDGSFKKQAADYCKQLIGGRDGAIETQFGPYADLVSDI